jgi:hypothetical protein
MRPERLRAQALGVLLTTVLAADVHAHELRFENPADAEVTVSGAGCPVGLAEILFPPDYEAVAATPGETMLTTDRRDIAGEEPTSCSATSAHVEVELIGSLSADDFDPAYPPFSTLYWLDTQIDWQRCPLSTRPANASTPEAAVLEVRAGSV